MALPFLVRIYFLCTVEHLRINAFHRTNSVQSLSRTTVLIYSRDNLYIFVRA